MNAETREQIEECLVKFVEVVVEKEEKGVATSEELSALSNVATVLMAC